MTAAIAQPTKGIRASRIRGVVNRGTCIRAPRGIEIRGSASRGIRTDVEAAFGRSLDRVFAIAVGAATVAFAAAIGCPQRGQNLSVAPLAIPQPGQKMRRWLVDSARALSATAFGVRLGVTVGVGVDGGVAGWIAAGWISAG